MTTWTVTFKHDGTRTVEASNRGEAIDRAMDAIYRALMEAGRREDARDFFDAPGVVSAIEA